MGNVAVFKGKLVKFLAQHGILVPARAQINRSTVPVAGETAFNSDTNVLETYDGTRWTRSGSADLAEIAGIEPTLDLIFDSKEALNPVTFVRDSQATYMGEDGYLKIAKAHEPRIEHDPITSELKGLLIEEQRSNLLTDAENFEDSSWSKSSCTIASNVEVAPDGSYTADKIVESTLTSNHFVQQTYAGFTAGTTYTLSLYVKDAGRSEARMLLPSSVFGASLSAYFNLSTVATGTVSGGVTATISAVGNGWYRLTMTATATSTSSGAVTIYPALAENSNYTGDGKSGLYLWGAQLEAGAFPTSYIPSLETFEGRSLFNSITYASKSYSDTGTTGTNAITAEFSPDGTKMYIGNTSKFIYQYTLSAPWDVTTATYASKFFGDSSQPGTAYDFRFGPDGFIGYRVFDHGTSSKIRSYIMSTPYDISTASVSTLYEYSLPAEISDPGPLAFSSDFSQMYMQNNINETIYQFTLSTPGDVSTAKLVGTLSVASLDTGMVGLSISTTGTTVVSCGNGYDNIYVFSLSTPWDITTAKLVLTQSISAQDSQPFSVVLKPDNSAIYILGATTDTVYQYNTNIAGTATYFDKNGVLVKTDNPGLARLTHNPDPALVHLAPKLLLEPSRTNLLLQSEDFSISWSLNPAFITITSNFTIAPDNTITADKIEKTATAFSLISQSFTATLDAVYTATCFVRAGTNTIATLLVSGDNATTIQARVGFNLSTVEMYDYSSTQLVDSSIIPLQNGWFRISVSLKMTTNSNPRMYLYPDIYSATNAGYIYAWGAQVEEGYGPTSYIPTTFSTKTRSADSYTSVAQTRVQDDASMVGANFLDWYNQDEGTLYADFDSQGSGVDLNLSAVATLVIDNDSGTHIELTGTPGQTLFARVVNNGSTTAFFNLPSSYVANANSKNALAFAVNNVVAASNGYVATTDTASPIPKVNNLKIGAFYAPGNRMTNGHIRRLAFFPERLSDAKLQAMTSTENYSLIPTATKYRAGLMPNLSNEFDELVLTGNTLGSNISDIVYTGKSFAAGAAVGNTSLSGGPVFSPDGRKMFISSTTNDTVFQYTLGIPWEVASASYEGVSRSFAIIGSLYGVIFSNDGTKMAITLVNGTLSYMRLCALSIPWNVSTAVYIDKELALSPELTLPEGQAFSYDGLNLYIADGAVDRIYQYALSEPWDISTATKIAEFALPATSNSSLCFTADGRTMVVINNTNSDSIDTYKLSIPWDITTSVLFSSIPFSHTGEASTFSLFIRPGGENLYALGGITDVVYQYACSSISEAYEGNKLLRGNSEIIGNQVIYGEVSAANLNFKSPSQTTVGAAGGASALPATPKGYVEIKIDGVDYLMPYYLKP